ncbi:spore germination protein [Paenibacillus ginsengarvi]|uniref:Spore germination protein n=1 Tax=Paenibacillus ginsengarvi TaxID=400777 RepID=A0A3B0CJR5_9BACL|nr:spore germination protein [Paenibacillus ginsengarvi]RKN84246.1 spore germination protein [Paenibacillus ginsengarvi]
MPAIIFAPIKITGADGAVTFGDVLQISPNSSSKTYSGSGGGNVGDFSTAISLLSFTITSDPDLVDSISVLRG